MKPTLLPFLFFSGLLYGATSITMHETAALKIEPDTMRTTLGFEAQSKDEASIGHAFNSLVKSVKRANKEEGLECSGGSYRISPRYNWANGKQRFTGYSGHLSFSCEFAEIDSFNRLSHELDTQLNAWPSLKRRQGGVQWVVSQKRAEGTQLRLEKMLIERIDRKAEHLSKAMDARCSTRSIVFGNTPASPVPVRMMMAESMKAASAPVESPIQDDATLKLGATVIYECE